MTDEDLVKSDDSEINSFLEAEDQKYGKNVSDPIVKKSPIKPLDKIDLGRSKSTLLESTISSANDNFWKTIPLENLPSRGMFYPDGSEITVRSATVNEIRHWSTIDENDMLDIDDQLNFIIEKCVRFKVRGGEYWLSWRDLAEMDRLYIIFVIYEITFPDGQNELYSKIECTTTCAEDGRYKDEVKVRSSMLQLFEMPSELMEWYSPQYKCFEIISDKLNETFYLYAPTIGVIERLRKRISDVRNQGHQVDKAFIRMAPYLIQDWSKFGADQYNALLNNSFGWHVNKLTFIIKFSKLMKEAKRTSISTICPKCGSKIIVNLFSQDSFTIEDLFLISGRLNQLV